MDERVSSGFALALAGHIGAILLILGGTWLSHRLDPHWGEADPTVGSIQASMVNSLPLPNTQHFKENEVLTSDKPSIAPTPPPPIPTPIPKAAAEHPKTEPPPKPNEILIPKKTTPAKIAPRPEPAQPVAPRRGAPPPAPTEKATTGETAGVQIPQSITQLKNGTSAITVEDRSFGDRYAYYMRVVARKINESKSQDIDPPETKGKRTIIHFTIDRDGNPTNVEVVAPSGSPALDFDTLHAIQRIDSFGPLPEGKTHVDITYVYNSLTPH